MVMGKAVSHAKPKGKQVRPTPAEQVARMRQASIDVAPIAPPSELLMVPLELIDCAAQVRTEFDDSTLAELAADIATRGVLQPVLLRPVDGGRFLVIAGERRLRACRLAQLPTLPAIVGQVDDDQAKAMQLAENIQREDLSLVDTAAAVKALYDQLGSVQAVADRCHKSKAWISKRLAISSGLNPQATRLLIDGATEDIETLKAISDLEPLTPGTNTVWALCEKIRAGKAGRSAAREALAAAKEAADPVKREQRQREAMEAAAKEQEEHNQRWKETHEKQEQERAAAIKADPRKLLWMIEREEFIHADGKTVSEILNDLEDETAKMLAQHLSNMHCAGIGAPYGVLLKMHCDGEHAVAEMAAFMSGMAVEMFSVEKVLEAARRAMQTEER